MDILLKVLGNQEIDLHFTCMCAESLPSCPTLCACGLQPTGLLCLWDSPGKSTGVSGHALLQGVFLTQGRNPLSPESPALQVDSWLLSHQGRPCISHSEAKPYNSPHSMSLFLPSDGCPSALLSSEGSLLLAPLACLRNVPILCIREAFLLSLCICVFTWIPFARQRQLLLGMVSIWKVCGWGL